MSDQTAGGVPHHGPRVPKAEFLVYFALIFVLAVLPHVVAGCFRPCVTAACRGLVRSGAPGKMRRP